MSNDAAALNPLTKVNQTLFNPVYARAVESARPNGIIVDPYAQRIVRESGYDFSRFFHNKYNQIGSAVRTRLFDRVTASFLHSNPSGTIVVMGCGLDARPYRMDNGLACWLSLDFPEVITLRERFFKTDTRRRHLSYSALDPAWIDIVPTGVPVLVLMEGVSMYLSENALRTLVVDIAERFPGGMLAMETLSQSIVAKSHAVDMNGCGVAYTWGADSGKEVAAWSPRIRFVDDLPYIVEETLRWGLYALLCWLPKARKTAKISLFSFSER